VDKTLSAGTIDLIVLDQAQDERDGPNVVRVLRRIQANLPVLLICNPSDIEGKQRSFPFSICNCLTRPLEDKQLEYAVRNSLRCANGSADPKVAKANGVATSAPQARNGINGYKSLRSLLQSVKQQAEKDAITQALEMTGWNRKAAARLLKTSYRSVLYKIEQYQMCSPDRLSSSAVNVLEHDDAGIGREDHFVRSISEISSAVD
jgi:DNA-binding NtrC family response regulator